MTSNLGKLVDSLDTDVPDQIMDLDIMQELRSIIDKDEKVNPARFLKAVVLTACLAASCSQYYEEASIEEKALILLTMQQLALACGEKALHFLVKKGVIANAGS